jgi:hypothetical protein
MQAGITSPFAGVSAACVATFRIQLFMPLFSLFFNRILMPFDSGVHGAPRASPCLHAEVPCLGAHFQEFRHASVVPENHTHLRHRGLKRFGARAPGLRWVIRPAAKSAEA